MATHYSIFAWRIPWTEALGRLQSIGSQRARHDWSNLACMQSQYWLGRCHWQADLWRSSCRSLDSWPSREPTPLHWGGWAGQTGTPGPPRTGWSSQGRCHCWSLSPFQKHPLSGLGRTSWSWGNPYHIPSCVPDGPSPPAGRPAGPPCSMCLEDWGGWLCCAWRWWWISRWWRVWVGSAGLVSPWCSLSSAQSQLVKFLDLVGLLGRWNFWMCSNDSEKKNFSSWTRTKVLREKGYIISK